MFSAIISEHFSKNRMIISVVAAKIWYLKNVLFYLGQPVYNWEIIGVTTEQRGFHKTLELDFSFIRPISQNWPRNVLLFGLFSYMICY